MLTKLFIRNFKRFDEASIDLGKLVVFVGPNNSGKTSALQALALWDAGLRAWNAKRSLRGSPKERLGIAVNRRDLYTIPVPAASLLWRGLHVRRGQTKNGKKGIENIRIDIKVEGVTDDKPWDCGFEFDFSNEEAFICRPVRLAGFEKVPVKQAKFSEIPVQASGVKIAYLPPMSGLATQEPLHQPGWINMLMGQGQTAQVLRNLCLQIYKDDTAKSNWIEIVDIVDHLFGVKLLPPEFVEDREIIMKYEERDTKLDLSSSGRGLQQTLLLLAHLYANPGTILLLDEPDAHLEILRQREILRIISEVAEKKGSQVIAATHSEILLNETATRGDIIAFIGKPHMINDRRSQLLKSLSDYGWDQYYQAEQKGWVLYLESASDLEILRAFADILEYKEAIQALARPFVHYISSNLPQRCREHFFAIKEAKADLIGVALFDRIDKQLNTGEPLYEMMWKKREIENYLCTEDVLIAFARHDQPNDLFGRAEAIRREQVMRESISGIVAALNTLGKPDLKPWSDDIKASDDFLDVVFKTYFEKLKLPILMRKSDYYRLARFMKKEAIDKEIIEKLDTIIGVSKKAIVPEE